MADWEGDVGRHQADNIPGGHPRYGNSLGTSPTPHDTSVYSAMSSVENGLLSDDSNDEATDLPLDFSVGARHHGSHRDSRELSPPRHPSTDMPTLTREHLDNVDYYSDDNTPRIKSERNSPVESNGFVYGPNGVQTHVRAKYSSKIGEPQLALPGMMPGTIIPGMFPMFPAGVFNGLPGKQECTVNSLGENGRSSRLHKSNIKEQMNIRGAGLPGMPPISNMDLASAQAMAANSEEMFSQYRKYIMALQDQLQLQGSPGGSSTSSTSAGQISDVRSAINSPTDRLDNHPELRSPTITPSTPIPPATSIPSATSPTTTRSLYSRLPSTHVRRRGRTLPDEQKDDTYWERRRKNNEAAKRSRDARRAKEDEIAIRAAFLEQENLKLRVEVAALKNETAKLRCMLYNS